MSKYSNGTKTGALRKEFDTPDAKFVLALGRAMADLLAHGERVSRKKQGKRILF